DGQLGMREALRPAPAPAPAAAPIPGPEPKSVPLLRRKAAAPSGRREIDSQEDWSWGRGVPGEAGTYQATAVVARPKGRRRQASRAGSVLLWGMTSLAIAGAAVASVSIYLAPELGPQVIAQARSVIDRVQSIGAAPQVVRTGAPLAPVAPVA